MFRILALSLVALSALYLPARVFSHSHHGCGHHGDCRSGCRGADCRGSGGATQAAAPAGSSYQGKVVEVVYLPGSTPESAMVEVRLSAGRGIVHARLATTGFLRNSGVALKEGDSIAVSGYWVRAGDDEMLVASELTKDGRTIQLRNRSGRPAW